jgi:hypothetical protein
LSGASSWDLCLARRAAALGAVTAATALLVVAATDAGGPWSQRLGMTAALTPLCGALGTLAAVRVAAGRGELRALAAVGASPGRVVRGAAFGGSAVGLLGVLVAASGVADLSALFPRPAAARIWAADADGLHELTMGLHVGAHGELAMEAPRAASMGLPAGATLFAVVALVVATVACPAWLAAPVTTVRRRLGVGGAAVGVAIVAFQAVAAGRMPALTLVAAPLVLLGDLAITGYSTRG